MKDITNQKIKPDIQHIEAWIESCKKNNSSDLEMYEQTLLELRAKLNKIDAICIKRYKCFKDFKINGLSRINIISGKNNVGKTALLEAFLLACKGDGEATIAKNRDIASNQYQTYLKTFNYSIDDNTASNTTSYCFDVKNKQELNQKELEETKKLNNDYNEFICKYIDGIVSVKPLVKETMRSGESSYINSSKPSNQMLIELYSTIQTKNIQNKFLNHLQKLDKDIKGLEPQLLHGDLVLRASLRSPTISLTVSELGEGVNRYIEILATMLSDNEYIFIDEIENGLHYSKLVGIARAVIEIAEEEDIQVFITTHDKDTIEAFSTACELLEFTDLCSIELYKNKENKLKAITRNTEQFIATVDTGIEVR